MGNEICCYTLDLEANPLDLFQSNNSRQILNHSEQKHPSSDKREPYDDSSAQSQTNKPHIITPELSKKVRETLSKHCFFQNEVNKLKKKIKMYYADDIYQGQVDQINKIPKGWGKLFKRDGSIYIGQFQKGVTSGKGIYVFANGSYFLGQFKNNKANCHHGCYEAPNFKYEGEFRNNQFQGKGKEIGDRYTFEGSFVNGKRYYGKLVWKDQQDFSYFYSGAFNQNEQFHGKGTLVDTRGIYEGDFVNGLKQGKGYFKGVNGIKYRGDYKGGVKEGRGVIYNSDETIAYKGEMKDGLPHGKGTAYLDYKLVESEWIQGLVQSSVNIDYQEQ